MLRRAVLSHSLYRRSHSCGDLGPNRWYDGEMIPLQIQTALAAASVLLAVGGLIYVEHLVRRSGRDRPHDPERVKQLVQRVLSDDQKN